MGKDGEEAPAMMAPPGREHAMLEPFAGTFRARVRLWMGPGDPMLSTGTMTNVMDLGGRYLRQTYKGDAGDGPFPDFEGRGFWGFNTASQRYEGFWIDSGSTVMQVESGTVDETGKIWTMEGQMPDPRSGGLLTKRSVITLENQNRHKLEMYFVRDGQEFKTMEIDYSRKK